MGAWLLSLALLGLQASWGTDRVAEAEAATKAFQELHFFSEGRGMMLSPGLISAYNLFVPGLGVVNKARFASRWGVVYNDEGEISGLNDVKYEGHRVGVMGCVVCHSGRAAGQFVIGLGNKNIDVFRMGTDVNQIERYWQKLVPGVFKDKNYKDMEDAALAFSSYLANEKLGNLSQGLVPISFIRGWFYRIHGVSVPSDMPKGQVKVPALWGYGEKRKVGQFCDGYGDGSEVGWAVAVELAAGQTPEAVRRYYPRVKAAEEALEFLLPPKYPFPIDAKLAAEGERIFSRTCIGCHGSYARDEGGLPIYQAPIWIAQSTVGTDLDRVAGHSADFNQLVNTSPLNDLLRWKSDRHGYFAPRLVGIWARFPYLHNGSVPTLADLLSPDTERPKVFSLKDAGERARFDPERVGLTVTGDVSRKVAATERDVYDTSRIGHSNQGHGFFTDLSADAKLALIEYLKTL